MADHVEQTMQDMVPELDDLKRKRIFSDDELKQIVSKRRTFEYDLQRGEARRADFINYIRYEIALECLRRRRSVRLKWVKRTVSDHAGVRRLHYVFDRALKRFTGDLRFWYQYIDFCLQSGSTKILMRALLRALKYHPCEAGFWLLAADRECQLGHISSARTLLLRGLRFRPQSWKLNVELLRLELKLARQAELRHVENADLPPASWKVPSIVCKRALTKLTTEGCAHFLKEAVSILNELGGDATGDRAVVEDAFHSAVETRRPLQGGDAEMTPANLELWRLWWLRRYAQQQSLSDIAADISATAPAAAIRDACAWLLSLAGDIDASLATGAVDALCSLVTSSNLAADPEAALTVLRTLADASDVSGKLDSSRKKLLKSALAATPSNLNLQLEGWASTNTPPSVSEVAERLRAHTSLRVEGLTAARLVSWVGSLSDQISYDAALAALVLTDAPSDATQALLVSALTRGAASFEEARNRLLAYIAKPISGQPEAFRQQIQSAVLDAELRVGTTPPAQLCQRFESVLSMMDDSDPDKTQWWLRYVEFLQKAGDVDSSLPLAADIHRRALRSVVDQTQYLAGHAALQRALVL